MNKLDLSDKTADEHDEAKSVDPHAPLDVQLARIVRDVIESKCSSFALDDENDQRKTTAAIVAALIEHGVRL
jgi:hypothetical protein